MTDDDQRPTVDQPLHGPRRGNLVPALAVIGLVVAVVVIFMLLTWLQKNT